MLAFLFGGNEKEKEKAAAEESKDPDDQIEESIKEFAALGTKRSIAGNFQERGGIADTSISFKLAQINLSLVSCMQDYHGVTLAAKDFCVNLNSYDGTNIYNPNTMDA